MKFFLKKNVAKTVTYLPLIIFEEKSVPPQRIAWLFLYASTRIF